MVVVVVILGLSLCCRCFFLAGVFIGDFFILASIYGFIWLNDIFYR